MKIEKISDNQVKILLNHSDLRDRDIKLTELAFGTDKVQHLFREMMEQAMQECGFHTDNLPLMIEAVPIPAEGILIIVTKVTDINEPSAVNDPPVTVRERERVRSKPVIDFTRKTASEESVSVFSFDSLDEAADASFRLYGLFNGTNILYKNRGKYILMLENDADDRLPGEELDAILGEYGQKHISTVMTKYYLNEHCELLIHSPAIEALVKIR